MKSTTKVLISAVVAMMGFAAYAEKAPLRFSDNGKFKIVQFTDIHWKPGNPASEEAAENMKAVLAAEQPDLVVITGDLVWAAPAAEALDRALGPVVESGIPFAVTWGNHDDEFDMTREELFARMSGIPNNYTDSVADLSGVTNYILPLMSHDGTKKAAALYVLDSNSYSKLPAAKGYAGIQHDQVAWYAKESARLTAENGGTPLPAIAFFHVPLNEYNEASGNESVPMTGTRGERACSGSVNNGMFGQILQSGDIFATFVGHDHINDYATVYKGIALCYGRYSGGKTVYCNIPGGCGARIIELTEGDRGFKSYIRLKDGTVMNPVDFPADYQKK